MAAMQEELQALHHNDTWELFPQTSDQNVIGCKWVYKTKLKSNGTLDKLKDRLVAKGYSQSESNDYYETFSPIAKAPTLKVFLTVDLSQSWSIKQLDICIAFLNDTLH